MTGAPAAIDPAAFFELLRPERLTAIVDVGANPIDGDPPYKPLLEQRLCRVIGFEPQADALTRLNARKSDLETYLAHAVGDGTEQKLFVCEAGGMTSLFRPDAWMLSHFAGFAAWGQVRGEVPLTTRRLDDIDEIAALDFLKIDAQGAELAVFQHGRRKLQAAVAIHTEVSFVKLYEGQPVFGEIDLALRELGFVPHAFASIRRAMIAPMVGGNVYAALNQLLQADAVYVRDFTRPDDMTTEQLKHLALIAHACYQSYDLAMNCLHYLQTRSAVAPDAGARYLNLVRTQR
jgi:FkbM family methyltransferase